MARDADVIREQVIEAVITLAKSKITKDDMGASLETFIQEFYFNASIDDLQTRTVDHLCESVLCMWRYLLHRKPGESKISVTNAEFSEESAYALNTVIMIVHDDMPFLLDSIVMEFNRMGTRILFLQHVGNLRIERDEKGNLLQLLAPTVDNKSAESITFIEVKRAPSLKHCQALSHTLDNILEDVRFSVSDWQSMKMKSQEIIDYLESGSVPHSEDEIFEAKEFIKWLIENHFTFLGYYETLYQDGGVVSVSPNSELGIIRRKHNGIMHEHSSFVELDPQFSTTKELVLTGKTSMLSTVHRSAYADFISIKRYNSDKKLIGEFKFVGLYTSSAYNWRPSYIPLLRVKVLNILNLANVPLMGHEGKSILNIIEMLPRDDIFLGTEADLYDLVMGILRLRERPNLKLFIRRDIFKRYYSCFVFVPKDHFDSEMKRKFQEILMRVFQSTGITFSTLYSDSVLARIHFMIRVDSSKDIELHPDQIEAELIKASRTWTEDLDDSLAQQYGNMQAAELSDAFSKAFPSSYREQFSASVAVHDIRHLKELEHRPLTISFYMPSESEDSLICFKTYVAEKPLILSDVIPIFEHLGLKVISEQPYCIQTEAKTYWINDFRLEPEVKSTESLGDIENIFKDAFYHIWLGMAENDDFNRLALVSGLNWREITVLRAYARYLWQVGFTYSQHYVEETLFQNAGIAKQLIELFIQRFDPSLKKSDSQLNCEAIQKSIELQLEKVSSLDHDRILRRLMAVIFATIRTNFFQNEADHLKYKSYISFKIECKKVPDLPLPMPMFEIFVYSTRMEGIHLRHSKVARGGIRWSDREDYRTEVLGLVKAQQVKNSVIVPMGAKGGFAPKQLPKEGGREAVLKEAIACYETLIQGMLDLTDNFKEGHVVPPENVVRYDEDDIYLVVAADKGTATFSDIANRIAVERGFWMGDAFASGGSVGYDHKKMGITARGAWESVKRHFREMGRDPQTEDFTVIGIGDMSGDVFGNGMLLSEHIALVAAFNHIHIFIDPNPDVPKSFEERKRLFELPRSNWTDYDPTLISKGGGVFLRTAKSIPISKEMQVRFGITVDKMEPNELIKTLLRAEVDLLWNGGIGTYIKSVQENNAEVGDKNNDALRVNGKDVRAKVLGEGGNLGCTQLGRVEYATNHGRLNTDAIDNSAGVDCSDHEVNIKILLNAVVADNLLTEKQRNDLLAQMTDEVAELVLRHNRSQTEALSIAHFHSEEYVEMHGRLMQFLEKNANLNRQVEFLPDLEGLIQRKQLGQGLTRPELAVLLAYVKIFLKESLVASKVPDEPYMETYLFNAFPRVLQEKYADTLRKHRLKREIIVTQITNNIIDEMGITFLHRLQDETGAEAPDIVCSYLIVREIFNVPGLRQSIKQLGNNISSTIKIRLLQEINRMTRRGVRWFLRHRQQGLNIEAEIKNFSAGSQLVAKTLPSVLQGPAQQAMDTLALELIEAGVPSDLANQVGAMGAMFSALDIVDAATMNNFRVEEVVSLYFEIGAKLELGWVREQIRRHPVNNNWDALARAAFRDDLDSKQRDLTVSVLKMQSNTTSHEERILLWMENKASILNRWQQMLEALKSSSGPDFTRFAVTLRELGELVRMSAC